jgi:hypothetical protein
MDMKTAPRLLQLIPDIFFDVLAYILPSSLLFIGMTALRAQMVYAELCNSNTITAKRLRPPFTCGGEPLYKTSQCDRCINE